MGRRLLRGRSGSSCDVWRFDPPSGVTEPTYSPKRPVVSRSKVPELEYLLACSPLPGTAVAGGYGGTEATDLTWRPERLQIVGGTQWWLCATPLHAWPRGSAALCGILPPGALWEHERSVAVAAPTAVSSGLVHLVGLQSRHAAQKGR